MHFLSNLSLLLCAMGKALWMTGVGPGIAVALAVEALCPICHKPESEFCEHDMAYLDSVSQLWANHQRWREETRKEQAEQMAPRKVRRRA